MPVSELKAAPYNPRRIDAAAMAALTKSIERFGYVEPIVFNKRSGFVVGGHQRLKVLRASKIKEVPVVIVDLAENEEKALNVALNSPTLAGEFTDDLQAMLQDIQLKDESLFESLLFDKLLGEGAPTFEPENIESLKRLDEKKMIVCPNCQHEFSQS
jgi:ParB-like chromosome segregation protein Spo0J